MSAPFNPVPEDNGTGIDLGALCAPKKQRRARKPHVDPATKIRVAETLAELTPTARNQAVRIHAKAYGVSRSTVYDWHKQWLAGELKEPPKPAMVITEDLEKILVVYYSHKGNATAAHAECVTDALWTGGLRSFQRYLKDNVNKLIRLAAEMDEAAARMLGTYIGYTVPWRDEEWQTDFVDLCVEADLPDGTKAHVWACVIVDKHSGVTRGWCLTLGPPTADAVVRALIHAARPRVELLEHADGTVEEVILGGLPLILRSDNGKEFLAEVTILLLAEAGTWAIPTWAYAPWLKGLIEEWNREVKRYSAVLPGSTRGPKTVQGWEPFRAPHKTGLSLEAVRHLFTAYVHERDRTPQRGQVLSPLARYALGANPDRPPRLIHEDTLARFAMVRVHTPAEFSIERNHIKFRKQKWTAPEMRLVTVDKVQVWYSEVQPDYVEVRGPGFAFQVLPDELIDPDAADAMRDERETDVSTANRLRRQGAAHARRRAHDQADNATTDGQEDSAEAHDETGPPAPASTPPTASVGAVSPTRGLPATSPGLRDADSRFRRPPTTPEDA